VPEIGSLSWNNKMYWICYSSVCSFLLFIVTTSRRLKYLIYHRTWMRRTNIPYKYAYTRICVWVDTVPFWERVAQPGSPYQLLRALISYLNNLHCILASQFSGQHWKFEHCWFLELLKSFSLKYYREEYTLLLLLLLPLLLLLSLLLFLLICLYSPFILPWSFSQFLNDIHSW
jgi:hypothetical protein